MVLAFGLTHRITLPRSQHPVPLNHLSSICRYQRVVQSFSSMALIEVEKKFRVRSNARRSLLAAFPDNVRVSSFDDVYFSEELALTNRWLRKRNTQWELKVPVDTCGPRVAAVFRELAGAQVWEELTKTKDFSYAMKPYARITTVRTMITLHWDQHKVNLTFDACSSPDGFGFEYAVGEVEILVQTPSEVDQAVSSLCKLLTRFELEKLDEKDGKLLAYLRNQKPDLYHRILQVNRE